MTVCFQLQEGCQPVFHWPADSSALPSWRREAAPASPRAYVGNNSSGFDLELLDFNSEISAEVHRPVVREG